MEGGRRMTAHSGAAVDAQTSIVARMSWLDRFLPVWIAGPTLAWVTPSEMPGDESGLIFVRLARCIALVPVWNVLAGRTSKPVTPSQSPKPCYSATPSVPVGGSPLSTNRAACVSAPNVVTSATLARRAFSTSAVLQLPRRIHTTLGGNPCKKLRWRKSSSLVTIANPSLCAWYQTVSSSAAESPDSRTWAEFG